MSTNKPQREQYGWDAVPRNRVNVASADQARTMPVDVDFLSIWPKTDLVKKAEAYVKVRLPAETFNHSLRVYCYGHTIVNQHLLEWVDATPDDFFETWALTCLFHDIGTTPENREATHMSFEFQGGFIALQQLQSFGAPVAQAESVCEAIIRHQDPGETGQITRMGQLVQIATEFDNMGWQPWLVHNTVIEQVVKQHPRLKWSACFAASIQAEIDEKPWCHTTAIPGFKEAVEGNKLMEPYD